MTGEGEWEKGRKHGRIIIFTVPFMGRLRGMTTKAIYLSSLQNAFIDHLKERRIKM